MPKHKYGWKRPSPAKLYAHHDLYEAPEHIIQNLPPSIDLRPQCPSIYDQGDLGSCVSNAIAGSIQYLQMRENITSFTPSRLALYYWGRLREETTGEDSGESVTDGIQTVVTIGAPPETDWPYNIADFTEQPPEQAYADATLTKVSQYQQVPLSLPQLQSCLAEDYLVTLGILVYESFESDIVANTGVVPMPQRREQLLGGHCIDLVGYNNAQKVFYGRNSWSEQWGQQGYFTIPYNYILNHLLTSDSWTIRKVS